MDYWLNVDFPTKTARLHRADCTHAQDREATELKGDGELLRDGGWLTMASSAEAESFCQRNARVALAPCGDCRP